ncbi:hypothetical protein RA307_30605 [Xanthobacteraceae bacterium Astr-EGSB]|uniref:hypothetical protein n=1 Tax=Astrobacterium formosum TaxID=3069710 RepID=UPI0027B6C7B6|nr:hypothetical protein [Xanthobacteraceae bacterium Astr-EGSB]
MTPSPVQLPQNVDITPAQRRQVVILVVAGLVCAWLTLSAAILEVMTALANVPSRGW